MTIFPEEGAYLGGLLANTYEDCDCLMWKGAVDSSGTPVFRKAGSRLLLPVRRVVIEESRGPMREGLVATAACRRKRCIAPDHAEAVTRKTLVARAVENTAYHLNPVRNAKLSALSRPKGKLSEEARAQIVASDLPQRALAELHGVSQSTIGELLTGKTYKDYTNPFSGLQRA